jgi:hypothetical protein
VWEIPLSPWQEKLITRLERGLCRPLVPADVESLEWNVSGRTLTVQAQPLLAELRSKGLISNVFRSPPESRV